MDGNSGNTKRSDTDNASEAQKPSSPPNWSKDRKHSRPDEETVFCLKSAGYMVGKVKRGDGALSIERDGRIAWLIHDALDFDRSDVGTPFLFTIMMAIRTSGHNKIGSPRL